MNPENLAVFGSLLMYVMKNFISILTDFITDLIISDLKIQIWEWLETSM